MKAFRVQKKNLLLENSVSVEIGHAFELRTRQEVLKGFVQMFTLFSTEPGSKKS